jgi:hypothetical protein
VLPYCNSDFLRHNCSPEQYIPGNSKVRKSSACDAILSHCSPLHMCTAYIRFIIISASWVISSYEASQPKFCNLMGVPCPTHCSFSYAFHINCGRCGVQVMKLLILYETLQPLYYIYNNPLNRVCNYYILYLMIFIASL